MASAVAESKPPLSKTTARGWRARGGSSVRAVIGGFTPGEPTPSAAARLAFSAESAIISSGHEAELLAPCRCYARMQSAPRGKFACQGSFDRVGRGYHITKETVHDVFVEDAQVAIGK